jgi:hypothetical protein
MISDTCSDAAHSIRGYLRDLPQVYPPQHPTTQRILELVEHLDAIRIELDTPPRHTHQEHTS